jgi:hypothetical protein
LIDLNDFPVDVKVIDPETRHIASKFLSKLVYKDLAVGEEAHFKYKGGEIHGTVTELYGTPNFGGWVNVEIVVVSKADLSNDTESKPETLESVISNVYAKPTKSRAKKVL